MKTAVIYTRVSTEEQAKEGLSLDFQVNLLQRHSAISDTEIYKEFQDAGKSAKTFKRPAFQELLSYIKRHRKVIDQVLFTKWDRFSRNATDALNMIREIHALGIEVQAIQQPIDFSIAQNKFMLMFYLTEPEVNNDVRAQATKEGLRRRIEKGGWVTHPPVGYVKARTADNLPTLDVGPKSRFVREGFEMISKGISQKEVRKYFRANGCPHSKNYVHRILTNRTYLGRVFLGEYKKEPARWVQGLHEPIIDEDLFNRVQSIITGKGQVGKKKTKHRPALPLRGHLECKQCKGIMTGTRSRGKCKTVYYYYYICQKGCKERFKADEANEAFASYLQRIAPKKAVVKLYQAVMEDLFSSKSGSSENRLRQVEQEMKTLKAKLDRADDLYIDGKLSADRYEATMGRYRKELAALEDEASHLGDIDTNYQKYLKVGFDVATNLVKYYQQSNLEGKHRFMGCVFPHKVTYLGEGRYATPQPNKVIGLFTGVEANFETAKAQKLAISDQLCDMCTEGGTRTHTGVTPMVFETIASTIPPPRLKGRQR